MKYFFFGLLISLIGSHAWAVEVIELRSQNSYHQFYTNAKEEFNEISHKMRVHNEYLRAASDLLANGASSSTQGIIVSNKAILFVKRVFDLHPIRFIAFEERDGSSKHCKIGDRKVENLISNKIAKAINRCEAAYSLCHSNRSMVKIYKYNEFGNINDRCIIKAYASPILDSEPFVLQLEEVKLILENARTFFLNENLAKGRLELIKAFDKINE